jgi:beta-glucosidase
MITFPAHFLFGAATSAYQVEGNNRTSDWWTWEPRAGLREFSGDAARHYELFEQDFALAESLSHNAHRLSVEWGRVEPEEGKFSGAEIDHYRAVIRALVKRSINPVVTLHHFTNPSWFTGRGGWLRKDAPDYFRRYATTVVRALCDDVRLWVTFNEPMVLVYHSYVRGIWPPQERSFGKAERVIRNLAASHIGAYGSIRSIYAAENRTRPFISIAKNIRAFLPFRSGLKNTFAARARNRLYNMRFIDTLVREKTLDFIGVNYYTRELAAWRGWGPKGFLFDFHSEKNDPVEKNSLGWVVYPEGLCALLLSLKRYGLPVFILENGICTQDDDQRWRFIRGHLKSIHRAMEQGVKVMGYMYWSLLDNFEWHEGFGPRFGIVEVDYTTYTRTVRESGKRYADVCRTHVLDD